MILLLRVAASRIRSELFESPRFKDTLRTYTPEDVARLRGPHGDLFTPAIAHKGAEDLWRLMTGNQFYSTLGAYTAAHAVQYVRAGLKALYLSGWQVAADANAAGQVYPDQSLYPANSVPAVVRKLHAALLRQSQIESSEGPQSRDWMVPIIADAEAGFGGPLNAYELMKAMIEAGAAGVHFEDQLASEKKCGHMGGKVLVPTQTGIRQLIAARLAADVLGVPTVLIARTDAESAKLITTNIDPRDQTFLAGERTSEGYYKLREGHDAGVKFAIERALAYAPYADAIWMETSSANLQVAERFANAVHKQFPGKLLAYNCSPSFKWRKNLEHHDIAIFQKALWDMGYRFQFVTLAGFHLNNMASFELAEAYVEHQMAGYVALQEREFAAEDRGFTAHRHQREVGTGYFDDVATVISGGTSSTTALAGSTEVAQFTKD